MQVGQNEEDNGEYHRSADLSTVENQPSSDAEPARLGPDVAAVYAGPARTR
jgi:hypothetical protein